MPILRAAAYLVLKSERAQTHLNAFNELVSAWRKEPYTIIRKDDLQNGRHIKRYNFKGFIPDLGMVLGEFLYCLRSGLDQMAWQLALPSARRDFPRDVYFPICDDLTGNKLNSYLNILRLFPADVAKEIDRLQPGNGIDPPEGHPLSQLNKLCNLDKHKLIPIHSRGAPVFYPHVPGVFAYPIESEDAIEVSVPIEHKASLDFEPENTSTVEIGEWESDWALPVYRLSDIHGFITCTVIPAFMPFNLAAISEEPLRVESIVTVLWKEIIQDQGLTHSRHSVFSARLKTHGGHTLIRPR